MDLAQIASAGKGISLGPGAVGVTRPVEMSAQVAEQLRVLIITGQIADGTHLVETKLSESFNVSRGPIRDALTQLAHEGLVETRRRGTFVVGLSEADVDELYSLRLALEGLAINEAIARGESAEWAPVEAAIARMAAAADTGDDHAFAIADLEFHDSFYAVAGKARLHAVWRQFHPSFEVLLGLTNSEDIDLHPSLEDHRYLYALVREGDLDQVSLELREHLDRSHGRLRNALARYVTTERG